MKIRKLKNLHLLSVIGFSGKVPRALGLLRASNKLVYPIGSNVGIWAWNEPQGAKRGQQHSILRGHRTAVVALAVSESSDVIASAENCSTGEWATVIIWSGGAAEELGRHRVHREEVSALAVAADGSLVFSLGGETDGNIVVWDVHSKKPTCSTQVCESGAGTPHLLRAAPRTPTLLGLGGRRVLKVFSFDVASRKFSSSSAHVGVMERHYTDIRVDEKEELMYCTTTTGDVVIIRLNLDNGAVSSKPPVLVCVSAPKAFSRGSLGSVSKARREAIPSLTALVILPCGDLITGDSQGFIRGFRQEADRTEKPRFPTSKRPLTSFARPERAHGSMKIVRPKDPSKPLLQQLWCTRAGVFITSLELRGKSLLVGNQDSEIYEIFLGGLDALAEKTQKMKRRTSQNDASISHNGSLAVKGIRTQRNLAGEEEVVERLNSFCPPSHLISSCPSGPIYDVAFPKDVSELVVTAGEFGIRVWSVASLEELLRVDLPGMACKACVVSLDLSTILTGWSDGRVRAVGAESGKLKWVVNDAHHKSVNCLAATDTHLVSAGADGRVRMWKLVKLGPPSLHASGRQHRGEVMAAVLDKDTHSLLSCGADGVCFVWSLPDLKIVFSLKADTVFLDGRFLTRKEIVTVGSDGSVMVWHRNNGSLIADLQTVDRPLTSVDVSSDDKMLVTSEEEGTIMVWNWCKGRVVYEGKRYGGPTTKVRISPDGRLVISVAKNGTIFFWGTPTL